MCDGDCDANEYGCGWNAGCYCCAVDDDDGDDDCAEQGESVDDCDVMSPEVRNEKDELVLVHRDKPID